MEILNCLRAFDGKHTKPLEEVASQRDWNNQAIATLLVCVESDESKMQSAATWVLKRIHEQGVGFKVSEQKQLLKLLRQVEHWEAKLHLLQILPGLQVTSRQAESLVQTIEGFLDTENNKLLRAWSYNGLIVLARQHTKFRKQVAARLATGQQEEAASIKARIRNALKEVDWLE